MRKIIFIIIFGLTLSVSHLAYAQVYVDKGKVKYTAAPGESIQDVLTIANTSDQSISMVVYWEDFQYIEPFDGAKDFTPAGTDERSMSAWVNFTPQEFTLPAYGKQEVSYVINVPDDISGGYTGVLFFEKTASDGVTEKGVRIITRLGSLFFVESLDKSKQADVVGILIEGNILKARFQNTGDVVLVAKGVYYIMSTDGLVVSRGELEDIYIPGGKEKEISVELAGDLDNGQYSFVMTYDLADGDVLVKEFDFTKQGSSYTITNIRN